MAGLVCSAVAQAQQASPAQQPAAVADASATKPQATAAQAPEGPPLDDAERGSWLPESYALDVHLSPAADGLAARARVTLRNRSQVERRRVALQVSSTLQWESASVLLPGGGGFQATTLSQHRVETDADHTGAASEAIVALPFAVEPGGSVTLDLFYSGTVAASGARLERIGADPATALFSDWDQVGQQPEGLQAALRGFGSVLWYPVASPQLFLGDGDRLFAAVSRARSEDETVLASLRLAVEYAGRAPVRAYFCGRPVELKASSDDELGQIESASRAAGAAAGAGSSAGSEQARGIATGSLTAVPLGFQLLSLFVTDRAAVAEGPELSPWRATGDAVGSGTAASGAAVQPLLEVVTADTGSLQRMADSAQTLAGVLEPWFDKHPQSTVTVLDHAGQPYEAGTLLVAPVGSLAGSDGLGALAHSLTHAWVHSGQPWVDEGLGQFSTLLWMEHQHGREAAAAQLAEWMAPVALAEPAAGTDGAAAAGHPIVSSTDELFYRRKAAAVWWMLRDIVGDTALQQVLTSLSLRPLPGGAQAAAQQLQHRLEAASGKSLEWFFRDWVYQDRGLPELTLGEVTSHPLPVGTGARTGWLVSVTVHNAGDAAAEVPLMVRSSTGSTTRRIRIAGQASTTERVLMESRATEVVVNDGDVPETGVSTHKREMTDTP